MIEHRGHAQGLVELALITPGLLLLLFITLGLGIVMRADGGVGAAASEAARAGALASDASMATSAARGRAEIVADGYGLANGSLQVQVDARDFRRGGEVRVLVSYTLPMANLPLARWGQVVLHHEAAEPVAPNRSFR